MALQDPGWELYRTFLEVVRDGSLSGAARRLSLTQPTAGRHIAALEAALGVALFTRSPRGLIPTEAALSLVPHAEAMAAAAAALTRAATAQSSATGTVRVTASEIIGCEVLPPILAAFRRAHPGITLELVLSNRTQDLLRRDADIAVRMIRPTQAALRTRRIGDVRLGLYAHQTYAAAFGLPGTAGALAGHCLIGFDRDSLSFRSAGPAARQLTRENFGFRCDSDITQLAAVRAGVGIGGCQANLAARYPDLIPVLPDEFQFSLEIWLAMHEDQKNTPPIRLLFDHLAQGLKRYLNPSEN
jgi:DNA-binding transcriptional LysR family regulator